MGRHARISPYGGTRMSAQRRDILRAVDSMGRAFTAEELVHDLDASSDGTPGVATVYRALAVLEASGYIVRVGERGGAALFARCDAEGHHHHLVCEVCGYVSPAECPLDAYAVASAEATGFRITSHEVTIYGVCASCAALPFEGGVH